MKLRFTALPPLIALTATPLLAHVTSRAAGGATGWWTRWNLDPFILANLAFLAAGYVAGFHQLLGMKRTPIARPRGAWRRSKTSNSPAISCGCRLA